MIKKHAGLIIPLFIVCTSSVFAAGFVPAPQANDDNGISIIGVGTVMTGNVMANDFYGDSVDFKSMTGTYGYLDSVETSGEYSYTAYGNIFLAPGEVVQDIFSYTLTNTIGQTSKANLIINISPNPTSPIANDDLFTITQNTTSVVGGNVVVNDRGGSSVRLSSSTSTVGAYGFLILNADGTFVYTLYENSPKTVTLEAGEVVFEVFNYDYTDLFSGQSDTAELKIQVIGNPVDADGKTVFEQPDDQPFDNVDVEFNDRSTDATPLNSGRNIKGHLHQGSDKDWFSIASAGNESIFLEVCPQGSSCFGKKSWVLYVFDSSLLTQSMEQQEFVFNRWIDDTGSKRDKNGVQLISGLAGSSNHMYLAYRSGFFDGALVGVVDPCFDTSNKVEIGVGAGSRNLFGSSFFAFTR